MGAVTYSDGVAIGKVVYYSPALLASVYICTRHGFTRASGWFFLVIFCIIRLVGSSAQLATIDSSSDSTAETIALVCSLMGTAPLLLSSLGLISRIYYSILPEGWSIFFQLYVLKVVQLPAVVGLILCIVGATSASNPARIQSEDTLHIGIILFLFVFVMLSILSVVAIINRKKVPDQERLLIKSVALALPFIFVHLVYSLMAAFSNDSDFSPVDGSTTVLLLMSVFEEIAVVSIYIYAGVKLKSTPLENASGTRTLSYRFGRGDFGGGKLGILSLVFAVANAFTTRKEEQADLEDHHGHPLVPRHRARESYTGSTESDFASGAQH